MIMRFGETKLKLTTVLFIYIVKQHFKITIVNLIILGYF